MPLPPLSSQICCVVFVQRGIKVGGCNFIIETNRLYLEEKICFRGVFFEKNIKVIWDVLRCFHEDEKGVLRFSKLGGDILGISESTRVLLWNFGATRKYVWHLPPSFFVEIKMLRQTLRKVPKDLCTTFHCFKLDDT